MISQEASASKLERKKESIILRWKAEVKEKIPSAKFLSEEILIDSLPYFIDDLSGLLSQDAHGIHLGYRDIESMARDHGRIRAESKDFTLDGLVDEYEILLEVILSELAEDEAALNVDSKVVIQDGIIKSITSAIRGFEEILQHRHAEQERSLERKVNSEAMEKRRLETTLDYLPVGIIILEKESGTISFSNRRARKICGSDQLFEPQGTQKEAFASQLSGVPIPKTELPHARALKGEKLKNYQMNWHCQGQTSLLVFHSDLLQPIGDGAARVLLVFQEIFKDSLSSSPDDRNSQASYAYLLTDDLRKPLEVAKSNAQALEFSRPEHTVFKHTKKIIESVEQADDMIRDLIDANKMFAGEKLRLSPEYLELNEEVSRVVSRLITIHGDRFIINSSKEFHGNWGLLALHRIVENILLCALKFGDRYAPILISLEEDEQFVAIKIHSTGPYLQDENLEDIFQDPRTWGIGLPLVKGLTEAHGGRVAVQSTQQLGTTFTVWLPRNLTLRGQYLTEKPELRPSI
ncbi:MAG TPA: sensor histidine kinase [Bacteriovoracaceae bacterium]|nr:sensor histidine kinase [Bacteriovoracaceae bacterium]